MAAWRDARPDQTEHQSSVRCIECGKTASASARGWRGYHWDEPYTDDPPAVAFYCPDCAECEFGRQTFPTIG